MDTRDLNHKQKEQKRHSNQLNKICSKLQISVKDIKNDDKLNKSVKLKIQKYIQKDDIQNLLVFLDKKVLDYDIEIGVSSMKWNIIHFAAKNNSIKILTVLLQKAYQQLSQKYTNLMNSKTLEGYTPLMITIIYASKQSFQLLLSFGGINIQQADNKNMTAYDLALNYKNQSAIRELMAWQSNKNKSQSVNEQLLLKQIDPAIYMQNINCYSKMFQYFVGCFLCFNKAQCNQDANFQIQPSNDIQKQNQQSFLRKSFNGSKLMSFLSHAENDPLANLDIVKIGNSQIQAKYSIEWKKLSNASNQKPVLFDCFQPFDICQNNLIIANNLIIFQCLSDHTWLVRKILKPIKKIQSSNFNNLTSKDNNIPNLYNIQIYLNDEIKTITVDQYIPFLKEREQPMFLSNLNQMWPQILQKGLAKIYGSYMKLSEIKPITFIQNFTGSFTQQFQLQEEALYFKQINGQLIKQKQIMSALQDFSAKGYLILLEGRQGTTLSPKNSPTSFKSYCYTVLNFFQKGSKKLILVNCPYVLKAWKEKQKTQLMQLKLIKSHYNTHNQMCVWIEESQFAHFFKNIIISFTEPNLNRTQLKMRYLIESIESEKRQSEHKPSLLQNITNSAKSIFSSKNQKRASRTQNQEANKKNTEGNSVKSIKSINSVGSVALSKKVTKLVFLKFSIDNSKNSQILSLAIKDNVSHQFCKIKKFKGWLNGGVQQVNAEQQSQFSSNLVKLKQKRGQYLCMMQVQFYNYPCQRQSIVSRSSQNSMFQMKTNINADNKENINKENQIKIQNNFKKSTQVPIMQVKKIKKHQLLVICWSEDSIQLEHIEQEFAMIEWIQSWRKNSVKNWTFLEKKSQNQESGINFVYQKIGSKIVVMAKSNKVIDLSFCLSGQTGLKDKIQSFIYEGKCKQIQQSNQDSQNASKTLKFIANVQMVRDSQHSDFQYAVLGGSNDVLQIFEKQNFQLMFSK